MIDTKININFKWTSGTGRKSVKKYDNIEYNNIQEYNNSMTTGGVKVISSTNKSSLKLTKLGTLEKVLHNHDNIHYTTLI